MLYKNICVHLDDSPHCQQRLTLAAKLAAQHDARLTGLYLVSPVREVVFAADMAVSVPLGGSDTSHGGPHEVSMKERFIAQCERVDVRYTWSAPEGVAVQAALRAARNADLLIARQYDPDDAHAGLDLNALETVVFSSGVPVLIVPTRVTLPERLDRVLIAWNDSREARRAVADALPLLLCASEVTILEINRPEADGESSAEGLAGLLASHQITAQTRRFDEDTDSSDGVLLLSQAEEMEAHLVVMGAYGHGRLRELMLGGVTRTMLRYMTTPILISH
ncbi:MAG: universal stress protein [Burkholderiales bacterium]|nr:universal stress protein [Burkholderiales bacterium]MDE2289706.1 universal stress protein [Burkholderiales bacterium]MDE2608957.1 universal stress protein [Burkholderiales bacterium]